MNKKTWVMVLASLVLVPVLAGQSITVTSPAAGSVWPVGSTRTITWTSSGISGPLSIKLRLADQPMSDPVLEIAASTADDGSFAWAIPASLPPAEYEVRVRTAADDHFIFGDSGNFTIAVMIPQNHDLQGRLRLESPNGGEIWRLGMEREIRWSAHFLGGRVMLQLYHATGAPAGLIADDQPPSGSIAWKAGKLGSGYVTDGQYKVRVVSKNDYAVNDMSDEPFTLTPALVEVAGPANSGQLGKPDLVICAESEVYTALEVPAQIHVGVMNVGKIKAKSGFAICYNNGGPDSNPVVIPVELHPGESYSALYLTPNFHVPGTTIYTFKVDSSQQVAEGNESNNQLQTRFTVTAGQVPANGAYTCSDGSSR